MKKVKFKIKDIPAVLWGEESNKIIIAVHGNMSNKEDVPYEIAAKVADENGYQLLSFDLPEHGDRKNEPVLCKVQNCVHDLKIIMNFVKLKNASVYLLANSMGAYFSLLAYCNEDIKKAWFFSPVVNMQVLINGMMSAFNITKEELEAKQTIPTPIGQTLFWDYFCYVNEHPIEKWNVPTSILYGTLDNMNSFEIISEFSKKFPCDLQILQNGEHYIHTPEQLKAYENWLNKTKVK